MSDDSDTPYHRQLDRWETLRREKLARTGWSSGGGWPLTEDEAEEALRLSGLGQDIDRRRSPFSLVIVGAGMRHIIETVDAWLDGQVAKPYKDQPLAQDWARVAKLAEELGELREASDGQLTQADHERVAALEAVIGRSVSALIGATGQNPRKGVTNSMDDVLKELVDVICTGLFALQHFTQDADETAGRVEAGLMKAFNRATGATTAPGSTTGATKPAE